MTILALLLLLTGNAEPAPDGSEPVTRTSAAEARFREGLQAYDDHDYVRAIDAFEAAYRASSKPEILFNIAQTYRLLGNCRRALETLDAFIASVPDGHPLLPRARSRREEIGPCPASAASTAKPISATPALPPLSLTSAAPPAPERQPAGVLIQAPPPPRHADGSMLRSTCIGAVGASAGLAGAGIAFGLWAHSVQGSVESAEVWDAAAERADAQGISLGRAATGLAIAAGVTTAIAVTTCLLSRRAH
jgi:hypothetical protein